jgi:hypothetical protein
VSNQTWQTICQIAIAFGLLLTAVGTYGAYYFGQRVEREKEARGAYTGEIKSQNRVLVSGKAHVWPQLEFGNSGAILAFAGPEGSPLFKFADDANLTIIREDGRVKVSLGIRDKSGRLVAELVKNEWRVNPQNSFDRNYSVDALEVRDPSGDVVLQVKALADRVQLQAKLYDSSGRGIGFAKVIGPQGPGGGIVFSAPGHPLQLTIQPMFKYPSDSHPGQLSSSAK